jgi:hypothetical protein
MGEGELEVFDVLREDNLLTRTINLDDTIESERTKE